MSKAIALTHLQASYTLLRHALEDLRITHRFAEQAGLAPFHLQGINAAIENTRATCVNLKVIATHLGRPPGPTQP